MRRRYARIFLTNTAQAGKTLVLQINELAVSEIEPELDAGELSITNDHLATLELYQDNIETSVGLLELSIITDDGVFVPGTHKVMMMGAEADETAPDSVNEGDAGALRMSLDRKLHTKNTVLEGLEGVDGGGDLQKVKEELELVKTAVQVMDDWDDADHAKVVPPVMTADKMEVSTDAGTCTIDGQGVGTYIEVLGYQIVEYEQANATINTPAKLKFETSGKQIWTGMGLVGPAVMVTPYVISNIRVKGGNNEALTLTGADVNAAAGNVQAIIYWRLV
jgi:hypothetical protein